MGRLPLSLNRTLTLLDRTFNTTLTCISLVKGVSRKRFFFLCKGASRTPKRVPPLPGRPLSWNFHKTRPETPPLPRSPLSARPLYREQKGPFPRKRLVTRVSRRFFSDPFWPSTQENKQKISRKALSLFCAKVGSHETLVIVPSDTDT